MPHNEDRFGACRAYFELSPRVRLSVIDSVVPKVSYTNTLISKSTATQVGAPNNTEYSYVSRHSNFLPIHFNVAVRFKLSRRLPYGVNAIGDRPLTSWSQIRPPYKTTGIIQQKYVYLNVFSC